MSRKRALGGDHGSDEALWWALEPFPASLRALLPEGRILPAFAHLVAVRGAPDPLALCGYRYEKDRLRPPDRARDIGRFVRGGGGELTLLDRDRHSRSPV